MVRNEGLGFALLFAVLALTGCATKGVPEIKTVEVKIPYRVPCTVETPAQPAWVVPSVAKGADVFDQMRALLADRELGFGYQKELGAALEACKR